jgi:hypothetical protein
MPDVSAKTHAQILSELHGAIRDVVTLRDATEVRTGYMGFELAEVTLHGCRDAIERVRDQARLVTLLKTAYDALGTVGGGDAAPAVERTRKTLKNLWEGLPAG